MTPQDIAAFPKTQRQADETRRAEFILRGAPLDGQFDYIIVGAGSAGCVLANRLSADPSKRVCLLEAGPADTHPLLHMPLGIALLTKNRTINWAYDTEPEPELNQRRLYWPRGRTLGGSSSINAMIYMRGHAADYDGWAVAAGSDAWGWKRVQPLFRRLERNHVHAEGEHHGAAGELSVSDLRCVNPLSRAFVEAGMQCQLPGIADFNAASQEGVGLYQVTQRDGRRWSSARAFLEPARSRPNLVLRTGAHVHRVVMNERRAVGVDLGGETLPLRPGGEVLLCGGAVNSPQLLMLSGIGPGTEIAGQGIGVVHDLPDVGRNLQDHLDITILARANSRLPIGIGLGALPRSVAALIAYIRRGEGFFTSNVAEAGGFARSDPRLDRPNLQFHFLPVLLRDHGRKTMLGYGFTLHVCDLYPKSRGFIGLASPDPRAAPRINANYLSHPDDLPTMVAALKLGRRIMAAPALAAHTKAEMLPGPAVATAAELEADIRARAETIYHPVGTCRMGADPQSVVDAQLRVRGVEGLRVVDASIMPGLISGNTNAPTMMIAENAADMMLGRV
jgi:choline dehydrogenase